MVDYGTFEEIVTSDEAPAPESGESVVPTRLRVPRKGEILGMIQQRYGGNRMEVQCTDGKIRNCRVPGRFKRSMWLRPRDIVLVQPWPDDDSKGDIVFQYHSSAVHQLRKKGALSSLKIEF